MIYYANYVVRTKKRRGEGARGWLEWSKYNQTSSPSTAGIFLRSSPRFSICVHPSSQGNMVHLDYGCLSYPEHTWNDLPADVIPTPLCKSGCKLQDLPGAKFLRCCSHSVQSSLRPQVTLSPGSESFFHQCEIVYPSTHQQIASTLQAWQRMLNFHRSCLCPLSHGNILYRKDLTALTVVFAHEWWAKRSQTSD